jgi:murein DD-endopeptidase MepM/ murein hydrolase activator NlpD
MADKISSETGVSRNDLLATAAYESRFNSKLAPNRANAAGLMQITPGVISDLKSKGLWNGEFDYTNPEQSMRAAALYRKHVIQPGIDPNGVLNGNEALSHLSIAGYNAGPGATRRKIEDYAAKNNMSYDDALRNITKDGYVSDDFMKTLPSETQKSIERFNRSKQTYNQQDNPVLDQTGQVPGNASSTNLNWRDTLLGEQTVITSEQGKRIHPTKGYEHMHDALDIAAANDNKSKTGANVYSPISGTVKSHQFVKGFGWQTTMADDDGYEYDINHQDRQNSNLQIGQKINRGDVVGYYGRSGTATGNHIDFRVRDKDGNYVNVKERMDSIDKKHFEKLEQQKQLASQQPNPNLEDQKQLLKDGYSSTITNIDQQNTVKADAERMGVDSEQLSRVRDRLKPVYANTNVSTQPNQISTLPQGQSQPVIESSMSEATAVEDDGGGVSENVGNQASSASPSSSGGGGSSEGGGGGESSGGGSGSNNGIIGSSFFASAFNEHCKETVRLIKAAALDMSQTYTNAGGVFKNA